MNLLILTYQGDIAGATYSIAYLAEGLANKGHNVYVGCRTESLLFQMLEKTSVHLIPMNFKSKFDLGNMRQIRDAVKKYNIELVNPQSGKDRYSAGFAKWFYKLPCPIVHTRRQRPKIDGGWLQKWFFQSTTKKIVAVSHPIKEKLIKAGFQPNHIQVIHNGTPKEKYDLPDLEEKVSQLQEKYQITSEDAVIGCVARLKKQAQLLEALNYISTPLKVLLVGIEENEELRSIIKQYKTNHQVIFTGEIPPHEAIYHYPLMKIKVLPSVIEGLSQALLEAMAMGIPVIATNAAGNPDLIKEGENGFLFDNEDAKGLASKIEKLLGDKQLQEKFRGNGRKTALEDFSIENTVNRYEAFFQGLI